MKHNKNFKIKVLIVFGTRPEAIKMAPVIKAFSKYLEYFDVRICVTAQHREMLDTILKVFKIKPDFDLNIMKIDQDLFDITNRVLSGMREILKKSNPDILIVQGDTTTAFTASLAAFYNNTKIAHIEAGLRTFNKTAPFPEEMNRVLTSHLADIHFAPTKNAMNNLIKEGISENKITITGNTVIDALLYIRDIVLENPPEVAGVETNILDNDKPIILITGHRRENFGEGFENICDAISELAEEYKNFYFIYPVHLNPNVRIPVKKILGNKKNILLIEPLSYLPFVYLMTKAKIILTDSGGIQEEAPSLGKPVLVMRDHTERPEGLEAGTVKLVGTNKINIMNEVKKLIEDSNEYNLMAKAINPYGDGKASQRIVNKLMSVI